MTWQPTHLTRKQGEERRLAAGQLLQAGVLSQADIARQRGVSRMAVSQWAKQLRQPQGDIDRLKNRSIPGRPPRLTADPWQQVRG